MPGTAARQHLANNPFVDGFFEWMGSREGQQCIEVHDVLWDLLEDVQLDAKQRQLIWLDAERLDLEQSIQRIHKLYPGFSHDEVEEFVLDWIDMGYDPENYSQAQLDELDSLTKRWVADHLQKAKASKKRRELITLEDCNHAPIYRPPNHRPSAELAAGRCVQSDNCPFRSPGFPFEWRSSLRRNGRSRPLTPIQLVRSSWCQERES
jgi:hypothetical protein